MLKNWVKSQKLKCNIKTTPSTWNTIKHSFQQFSTLPETNENNKQHENLTLEKIVENRRDEATRSIIVQVKSENSFDALHKYCSQFGRLTNYFHYCVKTSSCNYVLLEYENVKSADAALHSGIHQISNADHECIPANSRFLWFSRENQAKMSTGGTNGNNTINVVNNGTTIKSNETMTKLLLNASDLNDQIQTLYQETRLNDLGTRLRFLGALQIESLLNGVFPNIRAIPFGSSVNGFGKMGSDLDLILRFNAPNTANGNNKRLVFHTKKTEFNKRELKSNYAKTIAPLIEMFAPGTEKTLCISQARVPIIRYYHKHLDISVDLSMSNMSGFYMSELMHIFGEIDPRVRPLVSSIRLWAKATGLTNTAAGGWITNFSLTCLILCFLQQLEKPILPTVSHLVKLARNEDKRRDEGVDGKFLRDISKLDFKTENTDSLDVLLYKFFQHYTNLDLENVTLSLHTTKNSGKITSVPMFIVNPLETDLNVSKNVSYKEYYRLKKEIENVVWKFESREVDKDQSDKNWGLISLFTKDSMKKFRLYY